MALPPHGSASAFLLIEGHALIRDRFKSMQWYLACALEITADFAKYWDSPGGVIPVAIGMPKALITGERHEHEESENEKVTFSKN